MHFTTKVYPLLATWFALKKYKVQTSEALKSQAFAGQPFRSDQRSSKSFSRRRTTAISISRRFISVQSERAFRA